MSLRRFGLSLVLLSLAIAPCAACAQSSTVVPADDPPPVMREFRAVWVATVENMDWPSRPGLSTEQQKREMIAILDKLVELHMNAIILQVRPAADALYQSSIEPWSSFLTGEMGRAPSPYYDPLAFAVAEAHKRGLELHAWINPYRAKHPASHAVSGNHISVTRPELVRKYGPYLWLDPGDPAVRALTERVAIDLVRRYDIDGVHMDDYFYPYPEVQRGRELAFPDDVTWNRYVRGGGMLSRGDWRRENVNLLVRELDVAIHAEKPWVRFGLSPFGIWRPGYPSSVRGLDQYATLYADARKWFNEGWVDYFTPQLYWSIDRPQQRYDELIRWWAEQNFKNRHLWPGNYTGKVGFTNSAKWRPQEIVDQIRLTRAQRGATGNVHFNMNVFLANPDNLNETLLRDVYAEEALVPASPWLESGIPAQPVVQLRVDGSTGRRILDLRPGASTRQTVWLWVVQSRTAAGWKTRVVPGDASSYVLAESRATTPSDVRVMAVNRVGVAGPASRIVRAP